MNFSPPISLLTNFNKDFINRNFKQVTTQELEELAAWSGRILRLAAFGLISDFLPVSLEPEESDTAEIEKVDIEQLEVTE